MLRQLVIFVPQLSSRINYAFEIIFKHIFTVNYTITANIEYFSAYDGPKFSYGPSPISGELFFKSVNILFESGIKRQPLYESGVVQNWEFFKVAGGTFTFDPFASTFYMVTRYEEYLPHVKDRHGRYNAEESIAVKNSFLDRPVVNIWANQVRALLIQKFPELYFPPSSFSFQATIDIDNAYAYRHKGMWRATFATVLHLLKLDLHKFLDRTLVHLGYHPDPYDTYDKQFALHQKYNIKPLYFILLGNYGKFDKNLHYKNAGLIALLKKLQLHGTIGLHPSYNSSSGKNQIDTERKRLEQIVDQPVTKSRQHYIRLQIPNTYHQLMEAGIREDYSMGYPDKVGYRAGIATAFPFYDLESDAVKDLIIHPFVVMDTTLKKYLHIKSSDVTGFLKPIIEECKSEGGTFTFIFHNESMGGDKIWRKWGDVYERFIQMALA